MKPRCTTECAEDFRRLQKQHSDLTLASVKAPKRDDFRWLIEAPGQRYLAVQRLSMSDNFIWTTDHNKALAFRSEEQADAVMMAVRQMDRELCNVGNSVDKWLLFGFEVTLGNAWAREHGWLAAPVEVV